MSIGNASVARGNRPNGQPYAGPHAEFAASDQLPPNIRFAMNFAPDFMSGPEVLREWRKMQRNGKTELDMLSKLHKACMEHYGRSFLHPA